MAEYQFQWVNYISDPLKEMGIYYTNPALLMSWMAYFSRCILLQSVGRTLCKILPTYTKVALSQLLLVRFSIQENAIFLFHLNWHTGHSTN